MLSRKEAGNPSLMRYSTRQQGGQHANAVLDQYGTISACYGSTGMSWESHKCCQTELGKPKVVSRIVQ